MHLGVIHHHRTRPAIRGQRRTAHAHSHTYLSIHHCTFNTYNTHILYTLRRGESPESPAPLPYHYIRKPHIHLHLLFLSTGARVLRRSHINWSPGPELSQSPRLHLGGGACGAALVKHPPSTTHTTHLDRRPRTFAGSVGGALKIRARMRSGRTPRTPARPSLLIPIGGLGKAARLGPLETPKKKKAKRPLFALYSWEFP